MHSAFFTKYLTGGFLHQLAAQCHAFQLFSTCFYAEVIAVQHLDDFPGTTIYTTCKKLRDEISQSKTAHNISLRSLSLVRKRSYRFWLGDYQIALDTRLLHLASYLCFIDYLQFRSTSAFQLHTASNNKVQNVKNELF